MKKRIGYILTICIVFAVLTGCSSESRNPTMHEPGVYKGAEDPLLSKQDHQTLIDRFKLVQIDR
jgi:hypothetical protein